MKKFNTTLLLVMGLFAVQTSCSKEETDAPLLGNSQERLYLATKNTAYNPFTGTGGLKNYFLVLLPDGTAYNGMPKQSTVGLLTREQLIAENRLRVGEYVENDQELVITWTFNQNKVWNLRKESGGWRQNATKKFDLIRPTPISGLQGTYVYEHVGSSGFPGIGINTLGVKDVFTFGTDGTFTRTLHTGGASDGGVGTHASRTSGTYQVDGYALSLTGNTGETVSFTVFKWPKEEATVLALNGKRFLKE